VPSELSNCNYYAALRCNQYTMEVAVLHNLRGLHPDERARSGLSCEVWNATLYLSHLLNVSGCLGRGN
jgi:hypothetical protein